jgi:hypothetical protein
MTNGQPTASLLRDCVLPLDLTIISIDEVIEGLGELV